MRKRKSIFEAHYFSPRHRRFWWNEAKDPEKIKLRSPKVQRMFEELATWEMGIIRITNLLKFCGKCKKPLATVENFYPEDKQSDGWDWMCKACRKVGRAERKERMREIVWRPR